MTETQEVFLPPKADPDLWRLPKVNLHSHLEGSLRPETLWDLAQKQGIKLGIEHSKLDSALQVNGEERSLVDYLDKIALSYQVLKDGEALQRCAFEAAKGAAQDGVIYFELRAGPALHSRPGLSIKDVILSMLMGLRQAETIFDIHCGLIVAALRSHDPVVNVELAKIAVTLKDEGVSGFDLAGDEVGFPASLHKEAFRIAREGGLGITVHAGEAAGPENVRYAVEVLQATRIGHGIRSIQSPEVLDLLKEHGTLLEVCPTSNVQTHAVSGIDQHPVRKLFDSGVRITIADDDPTTSRTSVSSELTLLKKQFGFTHNELGKIQLMGIEGAFICDQDLKQDLRWLIEDKWRIMP
jgi:adenosine deaminase